MTIIKMDIKKTTKTISSKGDFPHPFPRLFFHYNKEERVHYESGAAGTAGVSLL
jgi:hypothetical protein